MMNLILRKEYVSGIHSICGFFRSQKGVVAVEYAVVFAGVAAVAAVIFGQGGTFESMLINIFGHVQSQILGSMSLLP